MPPDDAYGRVTNPERYSVVVDAARELIDRLIRDFAAEVREGSVDDDLELLDGGTRNEVVEVVSADPRCAPIEFRFTGFPGVAIRLGQRGHEELLPACGCDACDEQPEDLIDTLEQVMDSYVSGRYSEELTRRRFEYSFAGSWGRRRGVTRLERGDWKALGPLGRIDWPPWPARRDESADPEPDTAS